MKRARTILMPMLLPRLSDAAAAHLLEILSQLLDIMSDHYGDQAHRWRRQQRRPSAQYPPSTQKNLLPDDDPF